MNNSIAKALTLMLFVTFTLCLNAQTKSELQSRRTSLPNGWQLTPAGKMLPLGDLPLNIAVSPSGKLAAVTNNGQSDQTIQLIDIKKGRVLDSVIIGKSWLGLSFSGDGKKVYASGGNDNIIILYAIRNKKLVAEDTIVAGEAWPEKISIAGLAVDESRQRLYFVTKENNSVYSADLKTRKIINQQPLGGEGYTCILSPDKKTLYASCWGCDKIVAFDPETLKKVGEIAVGDNPNDMCITRNGQFLFVANANDNSVSVIDTKQLRVIETLNTALYPDAPSGSTTNSVALDKSGNTLYIANADNNCISVFDVSVPGTSKSKGFIPTGWYPTCVRIASGKILVSNGKGLTSLANPFGPNPERSGDEVKHHEGGKEKTIKVQYIGGLFRGTLGIIDTPDEKQMGIYSEAVYENTPYKKEKELTSEGEKGNPIPSKVGDPSPIKYVFYVIKENRTYDQVLGDMPEGNGDPKLCLFGEKVTPNQHAIAREFVLLDNFYVNGEVSADGHSWTMGAYATDFLEKNWPTSYASRGGTYPGEGQRKVANNKNGYLWDFCKRAGVTYRTYGEFVSEGGPTLSSLENNYCKKFGSWDMSVRDTVRFRIWREDFDSLLSINAVPQLNTIRFINNHTEGLRLGRITPTAMVADNDLAVGLFVDYLSKSPIWKETLILIIEDDAQNGPDHVDAHRTTAFLAGGYVKTGFVDHTSYTTTSLLRTMELILGLPPMSQYDASATPLWRCMNNTPGHASFDVRPCMIDLNEKNKDSNRYQAASEKFDFSKEDSVNDTDFNEVIWKSVRGLDSPCPAPVHAAFLMPEGEEEEEEEE